MSDVIRPIFLNCCSHTTDPYWIDIFTKLAHNQTPYGIILNDDYISCKIPDKNFTYSLQEILSPDILFNDIYNLLKNRYGLESALDKLAKAERFNNANISQNTKNIQSWSEIRKKTSKDRFIQNFAREIGERCDLTETQVRELVNTIQNGFVSQTITNKDIEFNDGKITGIKGILITDNNTLDIDLTSGSGGNGTAFNSSGLKSTKPTIIKNYEYISDNWVKLLKQLNNTKKK